MPTYFAAGARKLTPYLSKGQEVIFANWMDVNYFCFFGAIVTAAGVQAAAAAAQAGRSLCITKFRVENVYC